MDTIRSTCIELKFLNVFFTYKGNYYMFYNEASFIPDQNPFSTLKDFQMDEYSVVFIELFASTGCANMEKILELNLYL
jgi:hypothetical protein